MKTSKIKPEDINLLCQLLKLPEATIIFDPSGSISSNKLSVAKDVTQLLQQAKKFNACLNLSGQPLEVLSFDLILEPGQPQQKYKAFTGHHFLGFNNPDGSLRWFQPAKASAPHFLHLYNGSGWKARIIRTVAKLSFKLGLQNKFSACNFCLYSKDANHFSAIYGTNELAIFTGTIGKNRKAVAAICTKDKAQDYIKIPISNTAKALVNTEYSHLNTLSKYSFEALQIPKASWVGQNLKLNNIMPSNRVETIEIKDQHLAALKEFFENTLKVKILAQTDIYKKVETRINSLKHQKPVDLSPEKQTKLLEHLVALFQSFDQSQLVSLCYAHGDFTPWNMFVSPNKIHVYDWELAMPEQLPLFDLFHHVIQSSVLIQHQAYQKIKPKIEALGKRPEIEEILHSSKMNFWSCYRWYLLDNCSYYLDLYTRQEKLHPQANWLVDCWIEATRDAIRMPGTKNKSLENV